MLRYFWILCLLPFLFSAPVWALGIDARMDRDNAVIKFDLEKDVTYTASVAGGSLILRFSVPETIDPATLKNALPNMVSEVLPSGDKKTVIIGLNVPVKLREEKSGRTITITLLPLSAEEKSKPELPTVAAPEPEDKKQKIEQVKVRAAQHQDHYRVVFDWPKTMAFTVNQQDKILELSFASPNGIPEKEIAKIKIPGCRVGTPRAEAEKTLLHIECDNTANIKQSTNDNLNILDFYANAYPAEPKQKPDAAKADKKSEHTSEPAKDQQADKPAVKPAPLDPNVESKLAYPSADDKPQTDGTNADTDTTPATAKQEPVATKPKSANAATDPTQAIDVTVKATRSNKIFIVDFSWPQAVALAVFKRGGNSWMVFDHAANLQMDDNSKSNFNLIGGLQKIDAPGATVLKLHALPGFDPVVSNDGNNWRVEFRNTKMAARISVPVEYKEISPGQFALSLLVKQPGRVVRFDDGDVGDQILAAPLRNLGQGINGEREYAELTVLPSAQGIAVVPKIDGLEIKPEFEGYTIVGPSGLRLSQVNVVADKNADNQEYGPYIGKGVSSLPHVLQYKTWRGDPKIGFFDKEKKLLLEVGQLNPADRTEKRMELAKLYFGYGWMNEAIAVLSVAAQGDPSLLKNSEFLAMRGVANAEENNYSAARDDLLDVRFDQQPDIAPVRALMMLEQNDFAAADQYFSMSDLPNPDMPANLRRKIQLAQIESQIQNKQLESAEKLIDDMGRDPELQSSKNILNYWRGEIAAQRMQPDQAKKIWQDVTATEDPYARPRAEFALIKQGADDGSLKRDEIIARLERLRFSWRGDRFEFNVLQMLGKMQIEDGLYREGLYTLRRAITNYADQPYVADLTELMTNTFKKLFLEGGADNMSALSSLALFDEFRDLTPTGMDGDKIIQRLADRLIDVDLLERAEALLSHQVNYRLQGAEKTRVGSRLAFVYLLDRKPDEAIKALDSSNFPSIPKDMQSDRRLLRARALFDLNRSQEALDLISQENSREADLLRADIYWRMRNWSMAATKLQGLIIASEADAQAKEQQDQSGEPAAPGNEASNKGNFFAPETAPLVLNLAVATALGGDADALRAIKRDYWARMKDTQQFEAFDIITQVDATQPLSVTELSGKLDQATKLESFMNYYREKIKKGSLGKAN